MTNEEILSLRRLHDADCEPWSGDADYGYECSVCGKTLYLAAEMEPRGLCDCCKERLLAAVPTLLDEVDRLRAAKSIEVGRKQEQDRQVDIANAKEYSND